MKSNDELASECIESMSAMLEDAELAIAGAIIASTYAPTLAERDRALEAARERIAVLEEALALIERECIGVAGFPSLYINTLASIKEAAAKAIKGESS